MPGLYGLASLDGGPLDADDLRILSLSSGDLAEGLAVRVVDYPFETAAVSIFRAPNLLVILSGYLDEPEELAATLGLATDTTPVALAMAAVERYGKNAPTQMLGGWSLLRWEVAARKLTLVTSERMRDPIFFTHANGKLAFAPDSGVLCKLPWVGRELDPVNFPLNISKARLRHIAGETTMWKNVLRAVPQSTEVFTSKGRAIAKADPLPEPEPWQGSYQDALDASNALGRRIVRQQLARYGKVGLMLSGGLDSTLVACWAAAEVGAGQEVFCLTSVAPPGIDLKDEREYANAVARHLGLKIGLHYPEADRSAYVPDADFYRFANGPVFDLRHYVNAKLYEAAATGGAFCVMAGSGGEATVTDGHFPPRRLSLPLRLARDTRNWLRSRGERGTWPQDAFMARLAPQVYAAMPRDWEKVWKAGPPQRVNRPASQPRGIHPSVYKNAGGGSATYLGMRNSAPLMDSRFLRLGARMPAEYTYHGGLSRAMARNMLKGQVPDFVRLRYRKMPFGPDYEVRIARQAALTRDRLDLYRQAGLARWLDLPWIDARIELLTADAVTISPDQRFNAHLGILTAEFLLWNQSRVHPV